MLAKTDVLGDTVASYTRLAGEAVELVEEYRGCGTGQGDILAGQARVMADLYHHFLADLARISEGES